MRILSVVVAWLVLAGVAGCAGGEPAPAVPSPHHHDHQAHDHDPAHDPAADPLLEPAGETGTPALGQPVESMAELTAWVQSATGECATVSAAGPEELADYLGPRRVDWYGPFVAEWATCAIAPYGRLGLVLFEPGRQRALQEFWVRALASGEIADNPDWAFGNGFAVTAGPLGTERLGLRNLWCEPVDDPAADTIPADVDGCVYATSGHH